MKHQSIDVSSRRAKFLEIEKESKRARRRASARMKHIQKQRLMMEAIKEAGKVSAFQEVPVGAIILYEDRIIARAHNQVEQLRDATAHAEILAITQASSYLSDWRLKGCSLFVTAEPCLMCAGALKLSRISHIYFGAYDPKEGALISLPHPSFKFKIEGGILKEDCAALLKEFFLRLRKK